MYIKEYQIGIELVTGISLAKHGYNEFENSIYFLSQNAFYDRFLQSLT